MASSIPSGITILAHKPEDLTEDKVTAVSQATEASASPKITTAIKDSTPAPHSTRPSRDSQLLLIKALGRDLGKLLASSPDPDVYRTLDEIFADCYKGAKFLPTSRIN